jgi:alkaline phosphatase D
VAGAIVAAVTAGASATVAQAGAGAIADRCDRRRGEAQAAAGVKPA